mgnify:FL=1
MDIGNRQGDRPFRNPSNSRPVAFATCNEQSQDTEELESLDAAQVARCATAVAAVAYEERKEKTKKDVQNFLALYKLHSALTGKLLTITVRSSNQTVGILHH